MKKKINRPRARAASAQAPDPEAGSTKLKAERIQTPEAVGAGAVSPEVSGLKAERIQLKVEGLPGWTLRSGGRGICRTFTLDRGEDALDLLRLIADMGHRRSAIPKVLLEAAKVTVYLPARGEGIMIPAHFDLAKALEFPT